MRTAARPRGRRAAATGTPVVIGGGSVAGALYGKLQRYEASTPPGCTAPPHCVGEGHPGDRQGPVELLLHGQWTRPTRATRLPSGPPGRTAVGALLRDATGLAPRGPRRRRCPTCLRRSSAATGAGAAGAGGRRRRGAPPPADVLSARRRRGSTPTCSPPPPAPVTARRRSRRASPPPRSWRRRRRRPRRRRRVDLQAPRTRGRARAPARIDPGDTAGPTYRTWPRSRCSRLRLPRARARPCAFRRRAASSRQNVISGDRRRECARARGHRFHSWLAPPSPHLGRILTWVRPRPFYARPRRGGRPRAGARAHYTTPRRARGLPFRGGVGSAGTRGPARLGRRRH